jgi:hypothetical protein
MAFLVFALAWSIITVWSARANAETDFSGVSDADLLFHEDREAAAEEYKRRMNDYSPQQVREIEAEIFRQIRMPREKIEATVNDLLGKINQSDDAVIRMKSFTAIQERYEAADASEKNSIREAFLAAWAEVPYPATYEENENDNMMRYRDYAHQAGLYFASEEELLPILEERCLNIDAVDRHLLFIDTLTRAKIPLGSLTAKRMEQIYEDLTTEYGNRLINDFEYGSLSQLHQVLGRCGKQGYDAVLRMGTAEREYGIFALQINSTPEAEELLWEMYARQPENHDRDRLKLLRAIGSKGGEFEVRTTRRERVRPELVRYLKLPEGIADVWNIQAAVELAKDMKDPYYLPHVEALERAFFNLNSNAYKCPGMEDRMDEALATLRKRFDEAKATLVDADVTTLE